MFGNLGAPEIILIILAILILFGAKKIPELAKGIGNSLSKYSFLGIEFLSNRCIRNHRKF